MGFLGGYGGERKDQKMRRKSEIIYVSGVNTRRSWCESRKKRKKRDLLS